MVMVTEVGVPEKKARRALECGTCGACCLRVFDALDLAPEDPLAKEEIASFSFGRLQLHARNGRCPLLVGAGTWQDPFRCRAYRQRPRTCREFAVGGEACLLARNLLAAQVEPRMAGDGMRA